MVTINLAYFLNSHPPNNLEKKICRLMYLQLTPNAFLTNSNNYNSAKCKPSSIQAHNTTKENLHCRDRRSCRCCALYASRYFNNRHRQEAWYRCVCTHAVGTAVSCTTRLGYTSRITIGLRHQYASPW